MAPARGAPPRRKTVRSRLAPGVPRRVPETADTPPPELYAKPEQTIARVRTRRGCTATGGGMFERGSCTRANIRHCYTKTGDTPQDRSDVARLRGVAHSRSVFMSACVTHSQASSTASAAQCVASAGAGGTRRARRLAVCGLRACTAGSTGSDEPPALGSHPAPPAVLVPMLSNSALAKDSADTGEGGGRGQLAKRFSLTCSAAARKAGEVTNVSRVCGRGRGIVWRTAAYGMPRRVFACAP